jgi:hypothetical protein
MNIRTTLFFAALLFGGSLAAQVDIPAAYMRKFPYYLGNTKLEIEPHLRSGNVYKTLKIDPAWLDTSGQADGSVVVQAYLDTAAMYATSDTIIAVELPAGQILLNHELYLASNTVLKGQGQRTKLLIATGENRHGIVIAPREKNAPWELRLVQNVARGDNEIKVGIKEYKAYADIYGVPGYITLQRLDDSALLTSGWAKGCIREHFYIEGAVNKGSYMVLKLGHPLSALRSHGMKQDVSMSAGQAFVADSLSSAVFIESFVENAGVMCMRLTRLDSTASQTSNIYMDQAYNCLVSEVVSQGTNFAHICINNSAFNIVKRCEFSRSYGYGGNGRAYGTALQMGSSSNVVMDNYFSTLRHAVLLQAGANRNVIYANRSANTLWEEGGLPKDASGDIVLHGNYVYGNLIEMNNVQQVVIDDSHGRNGPNNIFFRNKIDNYGILMSAANGSDSQVFVGNEVGNPGFLKALYILKDKGHFEYGNYVKGKLTPSAGVSAYAPFIWKPACSGGSQDLVSLCFPIVPDPPFGEPLNTSDDSLPVMKRVSQQDYQCGTYYDRQFGSRSTAIQDMNEISFLFLAYPNPASGTVNIRTGDEGIVSLYDNQGKLLHIFYIREGENTLSLQGYSPGLYLLHYETGNGGDITERLIIRQ